MTGPHLKIAPNRFEWHVTAFLEPYGPPLKSFHFWFVCWAYLLGGAPHCVLEIGTFVTTQLHTPGDNPIFFALAVLLSD